jgi:glycosyltransferase involved in cell wall biosynthesis
MGTTPPLFQALSAWLVAALKRKPFILEVRDLWPEFAVEMGVLRNPILIRLATLLAAFLYRRAARIVVNSPAYETHLIARGVPAAKIILIPNGVDPGMFEPRDTGAALRARLGLDGKFIVCYAGALGPANDIDLLLGAAELLKADDRFRVLLAGDGKERPRLERTVRERGLANVLFAGTFPKREMPQVLAAADACAATLMDIPMFRTTYPNKVFDYMAAGRPVVLAIDGVIRDVVEGAGAGIFVRPGDAAALAAAVRRLALDPGLRAAMGRAGRACVEARFDRRQQAERFAALLEEMAAARGGG